MKMTKKIICILLTLVCVLCLSACAEVTPIKHSNNVLDEKLENSTSVTKETIAPTEKVEDDITESTTPTEDSNSSNDNEKNIADELEKIKQGLETVLKSDKYVLYATVVEIMENSLMVETPSTTDNSFNIQLDTNKINVNTTDVLLPYDLKVGDTVRITYDGVVLMSHPAKIVTVYEIIKHRIVEDETSDGIELLKSLVDFEHYVIRTSWTDNIKNLSGIESAKSAYQMFKFTTTQELETFKSQLGDKMQFHNIDNIIASKPNIFEENVVLLTYVTSGSGSTSYTVKDITVGKNEFSVLLESKSPEIGTCDMAGWFIMIIAPKAAVESCTNYNTIVQTLNSKPEF